MIDVHTPETDQKPEAAISLTDKFKNRVSAISGRYLNYWHGDGYDENQYRYYRCEGCHGLVTWNAIKIGGCPCAISNKIRPAALTRMEKARILLLPWSI